MLAVRAEIKLWEKAFRSENGRNPTVDDIRAVPHIADKYRLYKRLSKQPDPPALLPSVSRPAHPTAPLAVYNPFSPAKNKGKNKAATPDPSTPTKSARGQTLLDSPTEPSAVLRARKRLRGEPVSPSPYKEKRQRTSSYPKLPIPLLDDHTIIANANNSRSTIIGESPVKQPAGNKAFKVLFEESLPPLVLEPRKETNTTPQVPLESPLTNQPAVTLPSFDEDLRWLQNTHVLHSKAKHRSRVSKSRMAQEIDTSDTENGHDSFKPTKRSLLVMESDISNNSRPDDFPTLIPPSPPSEPSSSAVRTSKVQLKSKTSRKKAKISDPNPCGDESSEESGGDLQPKIKVMNTMPCRVRQGRRGDDDWNEILELDPDPILIHAFRPNPSSPRGFHSPRQGSPARVNTSELGRKLELDLPDQLRDVLALDVVDMEARDKYAERVVEKLIYNRRTIHYDPDKGGEIWDVGEIARSTRIGWHGEALPDTEGEDDWEGEPIPWEVAEL